MLGLLLLRAAASAAVDCQAVEGYNCQQRPGPADQTAATYEAWSTSFEAWRSTVRTELNAEYSFAAYDNPATQWAETSWIQPQAMLHDRFLFDRTARRWTPDRFLADLRERYGGVDTVMLWHAYPNLVSRRVPLRCQRHTLEAAR